MTLDLFPPYLRSTLPIYCLNDLAAISIHLQLPLLKRVKNGEKEWQLPCRP